MALDADNHSKGFAFVEFEEEVRSFIKFLFVSTLTCYSYLTCRQTPQGLSVLTTTNSRSAGLQLLCPTLACAHENGATHTQLFVYLR